MKDFFNRYKKALYIVTALVVVMAGVFMAGVKVGAADNEPGSVGDPLVSKSYLDSRLDGISGVMTKVTVDKGATLTASEGATMIVYSGNGVVAGSGAGMINVTAGELTGVGLNLAKYNTYLFPDAATGVKASSNMVVFITGTYNVTQ